MEVENNLDRFVVEYQKAGLEWVEAKLKCDQLEADEKNFLAALINAIEKAESEKISESKLERLARAEPEFRDYCRAVAMARAEMLRKKVRYDGLEKLFEAARSKLSFQKEQFKFLPHQ
jgi:hypothetical protein